MISRNRTFVTVYLAGACEKQPHTVLSLIPSLQGLPPNVGVCGWGLGVCYGDFRFSLNSFNVFSSNEFFRDVSAWYHMVFSVDSTDGTASDRVKWYVNGTRITSFAGDGFTMWGTGLIDVSLTGGGIVCSGGTSL